MNPLKPIGDALRKILVGAAGEALGGATKAIAWIAKKAIQTEIGEAIAVLLVDIARKAGIAELLGIEGYYDATCVRADGTIAWHAKWWPNTVTTVGKNYLLDNGMAGSSYTAAFYMGLISSTSYSAISAADTMASHAGWLEAGIANAPTYSQGARPTCVWSSASAGAKALSAALAFSITSTGTIKGAFLNTVATKDGTTGTLFSAGLFSGGDKAVTSGDTVNVSYSLSV